MIRSVTTVIGRGDVSVGNMAAKEASAGERHIPENNAV
jgi:hypothetical protein